MQRMPLSCVDLIYLDPPFKSNQNYNMIYKTFTGRPVPEQADAFCDTWEMDAEKERLAKTMPVLMREKGVEDYYVEFWRLWVQALQHTQPHLMAYLIYMVQRLLYMKTILKSTGSVYLHCDPTASHYIKIMMDGIFGHQNFRNEIIWQRTGSHNDAKRFAPVHDVILYYSKSDRGVIWNPQYQKPSEKYVASHYNRVDAKGRKYRLDNIIRSASMGPRPNLVYEYRGVTPEWGWRVERPKLKRLDDNERVAWITGRDGKPTAYLIRYLDEQKGTSLHDVWSDIGPLNSQAKERLGYQTQKPIPLLKRIIEASSNPGDVVFDPFCGCGTTIYAAHETERQWIGCDIAILAIRLIREILTERYRLVEETHFTVDGIPVSVEGAHELFKKDPFQFEHWAVERTGGFPTKKTGDLGIDGRLYFEAGRTLKSMVISVKGGTIRPTDIRDLRGVLARETGAEIGGFISLQEPTKAMRAEAAKAGTYEYAGNTYPRLQLLTVREVLEEKREFQTPTKIGSRIATGQVSLPL